MGVDIEILRILPATFLEDGMLNIRDPARSVALLDLVMNEQDRRKATEVIDALEWLAGKSLLPPYALPGAPRFMAEMHLWLAMSAPATPFGYGTGLDVEVDTVLFRGDWFERDRKGLLRPMPYATREPDGAYLGRMDPDLHQQIQDSLDEYRPWR